MYQFAGLIACCFGLVACDNGITPDTDEHEWQAVLFAEAGWEGLMGSAVVQSTGPGAGFVAVAEISGDVEGAVRPWHVHFNSCAEGGGIVGADGDYPRLEVGVAGTATATATVPVPVNPAASYHVNVHLSETEMATVIACGDLVLDLYPTPASAPGPTGRSGPTSR